MSRTLLRFAAAAIAATVLVPAVASARSNDTFQAQDPHRNESYGIIFDTLVMRPLGVLSTAAGIALLIPTSVIAVSTGHVDQVDQLVDVTVRDPIRWTWGDDLGEH